MAVGDFAVLDTSRASRQPTTVYENALVREGIGIRRFEIETIIKDPKQNDHDSEATGKQEKQADEDRYAETKHPILVADRKLVLDLFVIPQNLTPNILIFHK